MNLPGLCLRVLPGLVAAGIPLMLAAGEDPALAKPYVLFMGTDISVQQDQKLYRVEDVTGSELKIHVGQQDVYVRTRNKPVALKVDHSLKLSGTSVKLDHLESGPGYTPENDPRRKMQEAAANAAGAAAMQGYAATDLGRATANVAGATEALNHAGSPEEMANLQRNLVNAQAGLANSQRQMDFATADMYGDMNNAGGGVARMESELAKGNYDAMDVTFKISSEIELDDPYMVILFKFHARDAKPGVDGQVIHAESLDPITAKPRSVRVLRGGLPIGFKYVDCAVHIYNHGREVASNVATKRVELTRNEAQQYLVMEHLGAHKGSTVPAAAVPGTLPQAERQRLSPDQLTRTLYARISPDGGLVGVYADEGCSVRVDDAGTVAAMREIFFRPALNQGKPVEGIARLQLASL